MSNAALDIGSRLELFVDYHLVERLAGAELRLHRPEPQDVALRFDAPWEGNTCGYVTVFQDGGLYRMYYRGSGHTYGPDEGDWHPEVYCYAESDDGVEWRKPSLGLVEFEGSTDNNIILDEKPATHNFTPFKDANPACKPDEAYKGVGGGKEGLIAYKSADGVRWTRMSDEPIITDGYFDSQNLVFWDEARGEYREYHRDFLGTDYRGRDIKTAASRDFTNWPDPEWIGYSPGRVSELYTNGVVPYYRAPHIFLGFPTRYVDRGWTESTDHLPQREYRRLRGSRSPREGTAVTDGMFMSSRDGRDFHVWPESFLRPGLRLRENWFYGDNYQNWGIVETPSTIEAAANEISVYASEASHLTRDTATERLRRYTLRVDGFVSVDRAAVRRRVADEAARLRRRRPRAQLLVVRGGRREGRDTGRPRLRRRGIRALRLPRDMGRRPGARREVGRHDRRVEARGPAGEAPLRHQGRRPVLDAVPQGVRPLAAPPSIARAALVSNG